MKTNIQQQFESIHVRVIDTLLPNGFKVMQYSVEKNENKTSLTIEMLDSSAKPRRTVTVVITDAYNETNNGYTRDFSINYDGAEIVVDRDGCERQSTRIQGTVKHQLTTYERSKYSAAEFLVSKQGLEYLDSVRQDIQHYSRKLDLHARSKQLLDSAKHILKADKEQHGTLLAANTRDSLIKWIARHRTLVNDKLACWVVTGEKLQKKPLAVLRAQAVAVSRQAAAAPTPKASEQQLYALVNRFAAMHVRAS